MSADTKRRNRQWVEEYKSRHPCETCGEAHPAALTFHHLDPDQKDSTVSALASGGASIAKIKREVEKCQVLCLNCHAKLHWSMEHT